MFAKELCNKFSSTAATWNPQPFVNIEAGLAVFTLFVQYMICMFHTLSHIIWSISGVGNRGSCCYCAFESLPSILVYEKKKCSIIIFLFSEGNPVGVLYVECSAAQTITRRFYDSNVEGAHHTGACACVCVWARTCDCVGGCMRSM